nr:iron chelate uptake ABC transporter family permease subunit [Hymenobacter sp. 5516J-16]
MSAPLAALAGALGTTLVVVVIGSRRGRIIPTQLLLAGVAVGSLTTSLGGLLTFLAATEEKLRTITFWALGGFDKASWAILPYPAAALLLGLGALALLHNNLNLLLLGRSGLRPWGYPWRAPAGSYCLLPRDLQGA